MEYDLFFSFIEKENWKSFTESGFFTPPELFEHGFVRCFEGKYAELVANRNYNDQNQLLLLIIDPLRIHEPIKKERDGEVEFLNIYGKFSIDAIIDRISIKKSKRGEFDIRIKHFD